jgi:hypothetical protein
MLDKAREVHQGLGWFLREAWTKDKQKVEPFLIKWKDKSIRLIYQNSQERMTKEEKEKFRKEKRKETENLSTDLETTN